jgi:hypothetical protein
LELDWTQVVAGVSSEAIAIRVKQVRFADETVVRTFWLLGWHLYSVTFLVPFKGSNLLEAKGLATLVTVIHFRFLFFPRMCFVTFLMSFKVGLTQVAKCFSTVIAMVYFRLESV